MKSLPPPDDDWALFLDFDGTLVDIAPSPDAIVLKPGLLSTLAGVSRRLHGALAIVSGRPLAQIDHFTSPRTFPAAGLHGLERRNATGGLDRRSTQRPEIEALRAPVADSIAKWPGVLLEDKGLTLAVHYRAAPHYAEPCKDMLQSLMRRYGQELQLLSGHMVYEIKPSGVHKGAAIEAFMGERPFCGRRPVFVGDDVTDEDGFESVNRMDGLSIRVGETAGPTKARWIADSVGAIHHWLATIEKPANEEPPANRAETG